MGGRSHLPLEQGAGGKGGAVGAEPGAMVKAGVVPKLYHPLVACASSPAGSPEAGAVLWQSHNQVLRRMGMPDVFWGGVRCAGRDVGRSRGQGEEGWKGGR